MMEAIPSFETTILISATRRIIKEGGILHIRRREYLRSYMNVIIRDRNF
jgi:hypothetical protein